jgi:hypothetical protein
LVVTLLVEVEGDGVVRRFEGAVGAVLLPAVDGQSAIEALQDWSERYARAVERRADPAILGVGADMSA